MTVITIKDGSKKLSRSVFKTFEDLIDEYYASQDIVILHQVNFEDLPDSSKKLIEESKKQGTQGLVNFQG